MSTRQKRLFKDLFFYGTQFYRPPNPPADHRIKDLENIEKLGFNVIKIFAEWNWINHHEGVYDFDELIEIIEKAGELEINIVINARIESAPYWLAKKYPDSHYVSAKGIKLELQTRGNTPIGGWPGLCLDHPGVKAEAEKFFIQIAKVLGNYDNMKIIDCWNEPHIEPCKTNDSATIGDFLFCYCSNTIDRYREWLKERYKTLENLNTKWFRKYGDFTDIDPPRKLNDYVDMMEWRKFMTWAQADKMSWRYKTLKENLPPDKLVMTHTSLHGNGVSYDVASGNYGLYGCDDYKFSRDVDLFGLSMFPLWGNADVFDICCDLDIVRSSSRGKTCINLELQGGGATSWPTALSRSPIPERHHFRLWNFTDIAFGIKGIMYWQYRGEMLGREAPGFGLVKRDGSFTERSDETSRICGFLNKYPELFNSFEPIINKAAIVISRDSYYLNFASDGNENYSASSLKGIHRFLLKNNIGPDFLVEEMLEEKIFDYELIYLVMPFVMDTKTADILKKYVQEGGIIISDCAVGIFNRYGVSSEVIPSCGLSELFGAVQDELRQFNLKNREGMEEKADGNIDGQPDIYLRGVNKLKSCSMKMTSFLENYLLKGAEPLLEYKGKIAGTINEFGKGKAYLFGTSLGQSLFLRDKGTENTLLRVLDNEKIEHYCNDSLIIRDLKYGKLQAAVIINPNKERIKQSISFRKEIRIIDSYDKGFQYKLSGGSLAFEINPEDANCLIYEYQWTLFDR